MQTVLRLFAIFVITVFSPVTAIAADENAASWAESISLSGDLRLRFEVIEKTGSSNRKRTRYRGRFGINADLSDDVSVVFGLATGGDNPVSSNQDFGDGFSTKDIGLDLLSVKWAVNDSVAVVGGKMKQPWYRTGKTSVMWDSDLNPEGAAAQFSSGGVFGSGGIFLVEERSSESSSLLYYGQAGIEWAVSESSAFTVGAGFFEYTHTTGNVPFYNARGKGNTIDLNGNYVFDYRNIELFATYNTRFKGMPVTVFTEWVRNSAVDVGDTAYSVGGTIGKAKQQGSTQFSYAYHDTGADAIIGTFSDSDFAGGFTDSSGHFIKAKYALREHLRLGVTLILSRYAESTSSPVDYDRLMLDFEVKF